MDKLEQCDVEGILFWKTVRIKLSGWLSIQKRNFEQWVVYEHRGKQAYFSVSSS